MAVIDWLLQAFITAIKNLKKAKANSVNCTFLLGSFVCVGGRGGGGASVWFGVDQMVCLCQMRNSHGESIGNIWFRLQCLLVTDGWTN